MIRSLCNKRAAVIRPIGKVPVNASFRSAVPLSSTRSLSLLASSAYFLCALWIHLWQKPELNHHFSSTGFSSDGDSGPIERKSSIPTFYIYDNPVMKMDGIDQTCIRKQGQKLRDTIIPFDEDVELLNALMRHPRRTLDPELAVIFVIPTPVHVSWVCDEEGHTERLTRAMTALNNSAWFQRHNGRDRVSLAIQCTRMAKPSYPVTGFQSSRKLL